MPKSNPVYTCDVCGVAISENAVISYRISCAIPGHGVASFDAEQIYACNSSHALQAAQAQLATLEIKRKTLVEQAFIQGH